MQRAVGWGSVALVVSTAVAVVVAAAPAKRLAEPPASTATRFGAGEPLARISTQPPVDATRELLPLSEACRGSGPPAAPLAERPVPFAPGEVLEYDISRVPYFVSGTATASVLEKRPGCGSLVYRIVAEGQPVPMLARLYRLSYRVATVLDAVNLVPYAGLVYSEEGRRRRLKLTRFDPVSRSVRFEMETTTRFAKELGARAGAHDPLSLLYAVRSLALHEGQQMSVPVTESGRWYSVTLRTEGRDRVATALGEFPAWRLAVDARDETGRRPFRSLTVWFADDARRWPVKLVAELRFGPLTFLLRSARPQ